MTFQTSPPSTKPAFKTGIFVFGCIQLVLGLVSANWAWRLWKTAETEVPAVFWGVLALTLFFIGIAQINLVGPFRDLGYKFPQPNIALPYRLAPQLGGKEMIWPWLSVGIAFGLPVFPMILFVSKVEGKLAEFNLIWIGLTLMGAVVGGATLYLGALRLYQNLNGSETVVEASADTVKPGEQLSLLVQHTPGRLAAESIQVQLICRRTVIRSGKGSSGKTVETKILYKADLQPPVRLSALWQKSLTATLPEEALLSDASDSISGIHWGIDVSVRIPNAPDITETFIFTVDDPEIRAQWELESENEQIIL